MDYLLGAMELPLRPEMHLKPLKSALQEMSEDCKAMFVAMTGDDPWSDS